MSRFTKKGQLLTALKVLRLYNEYVLFPLPEEELNNPILIDYFESPFDDPIEGIVEKIIGTAAAKAVYDNTSIPQFNKQRAAEKTASEVRQALRIAKVEYHAQEKELPAKEYTRRKEAITFVEKVARIKKCKRIGKYLTLRGLVEAVTGPVGGAAVMLGRFAWSLLPRKVRKKLKTKGKEIKQKAITTLTNCRDAIKSTKVGQAVEKAVQKVKPLVEKTINTVKSTSRKVKDFIKSFAARF